MTSPVEETVATVGASDSQVASLVASLDSIFVPWLRNSVAHCSYLIDLDTKTVYDSKDPKKSLSFEEVRDLYLKAFGYLEGFKKAVHQFALETSGASYAPNWGGRRQGVVKLRASKPIRPQDMGWRRIIEPTILWCDSPT